MMQGDPADKPRLKAQAYSDEQTDEHKAKDRRGLPSSFIGIAMSAVVITVQHALCLAETLGVGGVFALKEFLDARVITHTPPTAPASLHFSSGIKRRVSLSLAGPKW